MGSHLLSLCNGRRGRQVSFDSVSIFQAGVSRDWEWTEAKLLLSSQENPFLICWWDSQNNANASSPPFRNRWLGNKLKTFYNHRTLLCPSLWNNVYDRLSTDGGAIAHCRRESFDLDYTSTASVYTHRKSFIISSPRCRPRLPLPSQYCRRFVRHWTSESTIFFKTNFSEWNCSIKIISIASNERK